MNATFWALVPPLLAIIVSLITKEVNFSLLIGIIVGAGLFTHFDGFAMVTTMFDVIGDKVHGNIGVLIFIILLGMIVHLMNLSGATHEYAKWAASRLKTRKQALLATMALGIIIFVDDYFNCLTVGTVMSPITDRHKISREKLAYIIDSTAAPICIIAPISSWAAAVSSSLPEGTGLDGFTLFMHTIPFNFYSWFSLILILLTTVLAVDFGKMRKYELEARASELVRESQQEEAHGKGKVFDLILPVVSLIVLSIVSMLYTGGFFDGGMSIGDAFANCDAIVGLAMGAFYTVIVVALLYLPRRIVTPKVFMDGLVQGFINMVPATLILVFAWTLGGICGGDYLDAFGFVAAMVEKYHLVLKGHLRHHASHHSLRLYVRDEASDRSDHSGGPGRKHLRRSPQPHLRHHHPQLCRRRMQPCQPCGVPDAVRRTGGRDHLPGLSDLRLYREFAHRRNCRPVDRRRAAAGLRADRQAALSG